MCSKELLCFHLNRPCNRIDTANRRNDPDLIADAHAPVFARIACKCIAFCRRTGFFFLFFRMIRILQQASQTAFYIMRMQPGTLQNILFCHSNGKTILAHSFTCFDCTKRNLMARRNILLNKKLFSAQRHAASFGKILQCYHCIILWMYLINFCHSCHLMLLQPVLQYAAGHHVLQCCPAASSRQTKNQESG